MHTGAPPAVAHGVHRHASVLRLLACAALGWILLPFYGAILWAVVIGLVFFPVFNWLLSRMRGRRTLAAVVTLALVVLAGMLPVALTIAMLALELMNLVNALASGQIDLAADFNSLHHALPGWLASMVDRIGLTSLSALQRRLAETLAQGGERMVRSAFNVGQDTFGLLAGVFITLYLSFFLVRDGEAIGRAGSYQKSRAELLTELRRHYLRVVAIEYGSTSPGAVAFCSGSGNSAVPELPKAGIDTLVTGELREEWFSFAQEQKLNLYLCGHYATEVHAVKALAAETAARFGVPWEFIATDNPL